MLIRTPEHLQRESGGLLRAHRHCLAPSKHSVSSAQVLGETEVSAQLQLRRESHEESSGNFLPAALIGIIRGWVSLETYF